MLRLLPNPDLVADLVHRQLDSWSDGVAQLLVDPSGDVAELRLDVPNQDLWFHELELRRR